MESTSQNRKKPSSLPDSPLDARIMLPLPVPFSLFSFFFFCFADWPPALPAPPSFHQHQPRSRPGKSAFPARRAHRVHRRLTLPARPPPPLPFLQAQPTGPRALTTTASAVLSFCCRASHGNPLSPLDPFCFVFLLSGGGCQALSRAEATERERDREGWKYMRERYIESRETRGDSGRGG